MSLHSCPDCAPADGNPAWAGYTSWCWDCSMRALAHGYLRTGVDNLSAGANRALQQELGRHYPRTADECKYRLRHWIRRLNETSFVDTGDGW